MRNFRIAVAVIKAVITWLTPLNFKQLSADIKWAIKNTK